MFETFSLYCNHLWNGKVLVNHIPTDLPKKTIFKWKIKNNWENLRNQRDSHQINSIEMKHAYFSSQILKTWSTWSKAWQQFYSNSNWPIKKQIKLRSSRLSIYDINSEKQVVHVLVYKKLTYIKVIILAIVLHAFTWQIGFACAISRFNLKSEEKNKQGGKKKKGEREKNEILKVLITWLP